MRVADDVLAAMRATNEVFCARVVRGRETAALEDVYTAEATILPPGAEMIVGLAGIQRFWEQAITGLDVKDASLATVSAEMAGETVVEIGRAELTLGGGAVVAVKYVVHWKHEGAGWRWDLDIWNTNA